MKIDFHCHAFPLDFFEEMARLYPDIIDRKYDHAGRAFAVGEYTAPRMGSRGATRGYG
jgi:hypothetical protein